MTNEDRGPKGFAEFDRVEDWVNLVGTVVCVCLAAVAAGLTMGIVSLESVDLRVKMRTGSAKERRWAARLLPLVELVPHHQVLVTLLLVNSLANETLPLFLDAIVPSWAAIVISVTVVLFVGELIPSAIFTGAWKLEMAAKCAPLAFACVFLASPVAYPLAKVLDMVMPEATPVTTRDEVAALVEIERDMALEAGIAAPFSHDVVGIVGGTMSLHKKTVADCCVPVSKTFFVSSTATTSKEQLRALANAGFSRVPIKEDDDDFVMRRYVLVKELVGLDPDPSRLLVSVKRAIREPLWTGPSACLFALLNEFQTGTSHIAFVSTKPKLERNGNKKGGKVIGIITLEDIMETIIQENIYDEADRHVAAKKIAAFFAKARHRPTTVPPVISSSYAKTLLNPIDNKRSTLLAVARKTNNKVPVEAKSLKRSVRRSERSTRQLENDERQSLLADATAPGHAFYNMEIADNNSDHSDEKDHGLR